MTEALIALRTLERLFLRMYLGVAGQLGFMSEALSTHSTGEWSDPTV